MAAKKRTASRRVYPSKSRPATKSDKSSKDHKWNIENEENHFTLDLGEVWNRETGLPPGKGGTTDNYRATIHHDDNGTYLEVGCHQFYTKKDAEDHWENGTGEDGDPRPLAKSLIRFVAEEYKKRDVKW